MAKKFRKLTMNAALAPEAVTKAVLADRLDSVLSAGPQQRYAPPQTFAARARQTPAKVMSFASRRRNH